MTSYVDSLESGHPFSKHNLPYGVFSTKENQVARVGVAVGDYVLDVAKYAHRFTGPIMDPSLAKDTFQHNTLNRLMALTPSHWKEVRQVIQSIVGTVSSKELVPSKECTLHLPVCIGDYTDFYSSLDHATNVGKMFRPNGDALLPNWKHLPVGYHGRASSVIVSGTDVVRPLGQTDTPDGKVVFGPCKRLDFELEMGFLIGGKNEPGHPIPIDQTDDHIFGLVLVNDWSARDVQKWEYVPLGPFNSKNFATTISPWVIPMLALEPFRIAPSKQDPAPLPYLRAKNDFNYDIKLKVDIVPNGKVECQTTVSDSNMKFLYWTMKQQLAHHTIGGCNVNPGDMMASGTISGPESSSFGSMLELSWAGKNPITLKDSSTRTFLQDGDTVIMTGFAQKGDVTIGFGECSGRVLPAPDPQTLKLN